MTREDRLPLKLCSNCTEALKKIDELSEKSFVNELQLRLLLEMDDTHPTTSSNHQVKESPVVSFFRFTQIPFLKKVNPVTT